MVVSHPVQHQFSQTFSRESAISVYRSLTETDLKKSQIFPILGSIWSNLDAQREIPGGNCSGVFCLITCIYLIFDMKLKRTILVINILCTNISRPYRNFWVGLSKVGNTEIFKWADNSTLGKDDWFNWRSSKCLSFKMSAVLVVSWVF